MPAMSDLLDQMTIESTTYTAKKTHILWIDPDDPNEPFWPATTQLFLSRL